MKEYELSSKLKELKSLKEKYRYFQISIDILKNEFWDPYDYPNSDKDIWEKQKIEEIKSRGQILKHLEEQIRELKKHIKKLNKEQNKKYMKSHDKEESIITVYTCDICPHKGNFMCCHNCPNF